MKGFKNSNDINLFMEYLTESKQLAVFQNTITILRDYFPTCDYYFALMNSKSNRKFLSVGSKKINAIRATSTVFRFKPSLDSLYKGGTLFLDFSLDKPEKNSKLRQEVTEFKELKKLKRQEGDKIFYRIYLTNDLTELESILKLITKSKLIVRSMTGNAYSPDDYPMSTPKVGISDDDLYQSECDDMDPVDINEGPTNKKKPINKNGVLSYHRDAKIGKTAKFNADYLCELDSNHETFIQHSTNQKFVEAHHLIPLEKYDLFDNNLDNIANIVSLCPNCHRLLHYGSQEVVKPKLKQLYNQRITRLKKAKLEVSFEEFKGYYF